MQGHVIVLLKARGRKMFIYERNNEKIGQYLKDRIEERFESHRKFCKKYLEAAGEQASSEQIRNMSNRISQILKGKKEIQLYDLPLFCQLLEVSCEDILSAGESHAPATTHLTNYAVAFSKDEREWESYVSWEGSPILNADEYGKTVIDYALEASNFPFLKYLMDKQYIWFVGPDPKDYVMSFGAGTSIEKAIFPYPPNWNVLDAQLKMRDELRTNMIALAIQHEDIEMLEQLHAREVPSLYQMCYTSPEPDICEQYYNKRLMDALCCANDKILEYFSEEFEVADKAGFSKKFLFPFIGELIERLLKNNNSFVEYMLKDAIQHNQYVYDQLVLLLADAVQYFKELDYINIEDEAVKERLTNEILRDFRFFDKGNLVSYFALSSGAKRGLSSNIIQINAESSNPIIRRRILELNELYKAIHDITPKF